MNRTLLILLICVHHGLLMAHDTLIHYESEWSYFDLGAEPEDQGIYAWSDPQFVDTAWQSDTAQLGYGDGDEATVINASIYTAYFRKQFEIVDTSIYSALKLDLLYDDGALVYVNGAEVWRINMAAGPIGYDSFAISSSGDNAIKSLTLFPHQLIEGTNVIAVEVHQRSETSSDISFDLQATGILAGQVDLVRGPYLQKGAPTRMTVKWRTSNPAPSIIDYGMAFDNLSLQSSDSVLKFDHEVEILNLDPNTKYFYQILSQQGVLMESSVDLYFKTAPLTGVNQPVRAWILGDPGTANSNARAVRDAYYNYVGQDHTDMMLFLGDNAYGIGTDEEYQFAVFENMYEDKLKNTVAWSTLGNHDGASASSGSQTGPYYEIFTFPTQGEAGGIASGTEAYYSFDYANIHFIVLDSYDSDRSIGGAMYSWCQADLQNTAAEWIVALWHHPAYSMGSHNSDTEGRLVDMREHFLPLLEMYGVDLVLSGHSHSYERSYYINGHYDISDSFDINTHTVGPYGSGDGSPDGNGAYQNPACNDPGAVYITAGSSGRISDGTLDHEAMYKSLKELGSCVLEVEGTTLKVKFLQADNTFQDSFTIDKSPCYIKQQVCSEITQTFGDVEELADGSIYSNSSDLELIYDPVRGYQTVGLIFSNLSIPSGSWIQSAHIQFTSDNDINSPGDPSNMLISGHNLGNAPYFDGTSHEVTNREKTNETISWVPPSWTDSFANTVDQQTPDLSGIIQEIVNRTDYDQQSNIGFTLSGEGTRWAVSFDHPTQVAPPTLCVEYTGCPKTQFIANENIEIESYAASHQVLSEVKVTKEQTAYTSGNSIELLPNFEVNLGSTFKAYVLGCKK